MEEVLFEKFRHSSISGEISERILNLIKERKLKPGDKLPPERELSSSMGVSRSSLRETLRALSMMNIIDIRHGSGTFVSSLANDLLIEHLDFLFTLNDATYLEMFEARKGIEPYISSLSAQRATPNDIHELEKYLRFAISYTNNPEEFAQADRQIHEIILRSTNNQILIQFSKSLSQLSHASRFRTFEIPGLPKKTIDELQRIVEAIKCHRPEEAYQAMLDHLERLEVNIRAYPKLNSVG